MRRDRNLEGTSGIESLERRMLMTGTAVPTPWVINGTNNADSIIVKMSGADILALVNGLVASVNYSFETRPAGSVLNITINGLGSPDRIEVDPAIGVPVTINGGGGGDTIIGTNGADVINGGAGNDEIYGGAGDDTIYGNGGCDLLFGGAGRDLLAGGPASDTLRGGGGADTLIGGTGNNVIYGGPGNDYIDATNSDVFRDTIDAGTGADTVHGNTDDVLANVETSVLV